MLINIITNSQDAKQRRLHSYCLGYEQFTDERTQHGGPYYN